MPSKEIVKMVPVGIQTKWLPKGWKHGDVVDLPMSNIEPNPWNPNEMTMDEFNMLSENMEDVDFLDPLLVVPIGNDLFRIIDGEHRFEARKLRDERMVKCVLCDPERIPEVKQKFQTVRMNKIRGKLNQKKFNALVQDIFKTGEYTYDQLAHELGFTDGDEFTTMLDKARESLPTAEMKKDFDKARGEIKTVDDLSLVLNNLFTKYGSTLPFNFMILDFGGKEHLWVRMKPSEYKKVVSQARSCVEANVTFDSVISQVLAVMDMKKFADKYRDRLDAPTPEGEVPNIDTLTVSEEVAHE